MNVKSIQFNDGDVAKVEGKISEHSICMSYLMAFLPLFSLKKGQVKPKHDSN